MTNKTFLSNEFTLPQYTTRPDVPFTNPTTNLNIFKKEVDDALFVKDQYERIQNQYTDFNTNMHNGNACNAYNNIKKARKPRKVFSQFAQRELETEFQRSPYLTAWKRQQLAQKLNLTERQVRVWFQNRRMRNKNDEKNRKKSPSTKKVQTQKTDLNTDKQTTQIQSTNGYIDDFKDIPQPVDEMKNIQPPMYNLLHHQNNYQKPNQFPDYNGTTDFTNNQIDPINNTTPLNNEEMWTYPKYSSYEALLNDHQDTILGGYNFNNTNVGLNPTNRNNTELSHFTSLQNLVYQYE